MRRAMLVLGALCAFVGAHATGAAPAGALLDTVTVSATRATPTDGHFHFGAGQTYTLVVSGTDAEATSGYQGDALYCLHGNPCPARDVSLELRLGSGPAQAFDAFQKPLAHPETGNPTCGAASCVGGLAYRPDHVYTATFVAPASGLATFGTSFQYAFQNHPYYTSGSFTIKVYGGTAPSHGGSSTPATAKLVAHGKVEVQHNGAAWEPVTSLADVQDGDKIHTGWKGSATITLPDGSTVEMDSMSVVELTDIGHGKTSGKSKQSAHILVRLGEVKAQVNKIQGAAGDFIVRTPTTTASVRGTAFTVLYDGSVSVVSVLVHSVEVTPSHGRGVLVTAGHEVAATAAAVSAPTSIGHAGAPSGSVGPAKAIGVVSAAFAHTLAACGSTPYSVSLTPRTGGYRATVAMTGEHAGSAVWTIAGAHATPANALAKLIVGACKAGGAAAAPSVSGSWEPSGPPSPPWVFRLSGDKLTGAWQGTGAHASLRGAFTGASAGSDTYAGTFSITEGATHVTGTMTVRLVSADKLVVTLTPANGSSSTLTFTRKNG